ncbi:MAG: zf-HC2 domain-containing protein [Lachnospiraceae bacterium]|nr:zf-HC2 domain-containing protein [Lachnospiraceae bacterium]
MKINCEIVQDLIPTYVEGLCSESSKVCVEEHIVTCEECRAFVENCRDVEFTARELEEKQLDGLRKVKKKLKLQNLMSYGLLLVVIVFGAYLFTTNFGLVGARWYYGLFAVALVATYLVTMQGKKNARYDKVEKVMFALSLSAIGYALFWYVFIMGSTGNGNIPLGMALGEVGPFLHRQTGIAISVELAVFAYAMVRYIKWDVVCRGVLLLGLTGIFFILAQTALLGVLSDVETHMQSFTEITVVIFGMAAVGGLVLWCVERRRK